MHECIEVSGVLPTVVPLIKAPPTSTDVLGIRGEAVMASNNIMTEDKPSSELDYDEKKPEFDDKSDKDTYSNGSNCNSEIRVHGPCIL